MDGFVPLFPFHFAFLYHLGWRRTRGEPLWWHGRRHGWHAGRFQFQFRLVPGMFFYVGFLMCFSGNNILILFFFFFFFFFYINSLLTVDFLPFIYSLFLGSSGGGGHRDPFDLFREMFNMGGSGGGMGDFSDDGWRDGCFGSDKTMETSRPFEGLLRNLKWMGFLVSWNVCDMYNFLISTISPLRWAISIPNVSLLPIRQVSPSIMGFISFETVTFVR